MSYLIAPEITVDKIGAADAVVATGAAGRMRLRQQPDETAIFYMIRFPTDTGAPAIKAPGEDTLIPPMGEVQMVIRPGQTVAFIEALTGGESGTFSVEEIFYVGH